MAYSTGCSSAPRVNVFSNPELKYAGSPQGTDQADNARVLNEAMVSSLVLPVYCGRGEARGGEGRRRLNADGEMLECLFLQCIVCKTSSKPFNRSPVHGFWLQSGSVSSGPQRVFA